MKRALLLLLTLQALSGRAQETVAPHLDCTATCINGQTERTELIFYPSRQEALTAPFERSGFYRSLNGLWKFLYADSDKALPADVERTDAARAAAWSDIRVPGNWEVQGHGTAIYVNQPYEFYPVNPQPPTLPEANPVGVYHRTFEVPEAWAGREVFLNLAGAKSGVYVYVNGQSVGYSEDSKDAVRFNITPQLRKGENDLVLKIYRWSTGSYLECMDFWRISGIERDVYLSTERQKAFDVRIVPTLDKSYRNGLMTLTVNTEGRRDFRYELLAPDGRIVARDGGTLTGSGRYNTEIADVAAWSAEQPNLYTLLMCVDGDWTRFKVGFRSIELGSCEDHGRRVGVLLVNGQPVKFKGVNLHEHDPYTGHYVTRETILKDLELMRACNINAIRTCHYPQQRLFYELCDSLGFYVYSEANIESHGMGYNLNRTLGNTPAWYAKHLQRVKNMYYRTGNYASTTILSLGNEAGNGYNFYRCYDAVTELEKEGLRRPVCYERAEWEWNTDMIVPQYPGAAWFRSMGKNGCDRPVCPSEYAHAMGNSTGSLDLQWEPIYRHKHLQGGFIWDWVDQGLDKVNDRGRHFWAYGGDYGVDAPSDNNFLCNGVVNPDRNPHPGHAEVAHVYQDIAVEPTGDKSEYTVWNRFYFNDLTGYELHWTLLRDGRAVKKGAQRFTTAPQSREKFSVQLPKLLPASEYLITFDWVCVADGLLRPAGSVVASDQFTIQEGRRAARTMAKGKVDVTEREGLIVLRSAKSEMTIDSEKGVITSIKAAGREQLTAPIQPSFWRAPTDNDYGNGMPLRAQIFKENERRFTATVKTRQTDGGAEAVIDYALPSKNPCTLTCTMSADGVILFDLDFKGVASEKPIDVPRVGLKMQLPASADAFRYYGRGPRENYCDRFTGSNVGIYDASAQAEYFPYVRPQECGHHTGCRWIQIGNVTFVAADKPFEFNALRQTTDDLDSEESKHDYQWPNRTPNEKHDPAEAKNRLRRQHHIDDVETRDFVELHLDAGMSGVAGYDSWGSRPEPARTLWSNRDYRLRVAMVPSRDAEKAARINYAE